MHQDSWWLDLSCSCQENSKIFQPLQKSNHKIHKIHKIKVILRTLKKVQEFCSSSPGMSIHGPSPQPSCHWWQGSRPPERSSPWNPLGAARKVGSHPAGKSWMILESFFLKKIPVVNRWSHHPLSIDFFWRQCEKNMEPCALDDPEETLVAILFCRALIVHGSDSARASHMSGHASSVRWFPVVSRLGTRARH